MKKIISILFLISCTKTNQSISLDMQFVADYQIQYWKDTVANASNQWECPGKTTWLSDTSITFERHQEPVINNEPHRALIDLLYKDSLIRTYFIFKEKLQE